MTKTVDAYVPDFGVGPRRDPGSTPNPWLNEMPDRWVAPYPDGYTDAEALLASLTAELEQIDDHITAATRSGDGLLTVELRGRKDVLPSLIAGAETTFL